MHTQSTYMRLLDNLEYDIEHNQARNEEAVDLNFPLVHTSSNDPFTNYIISVSEHFGQHVVAERTDGYNKSYSFKCSVKGCQMRLVFRTKSGYLYLNKEKTQFSHSKEAHSGNIRYKHRMSEKTFKELISISKRQLKLREFLKSHKELRGFPPKLLYNVRAQLTGQSKLKRNLNINK